jgi:hypothetical protein
MIHYHGTPCGGTREEVTRFLAGRHALVPWTRPEDLGAVAEVCQSFAFDNGAFTAWKSGEPITDWKPYYSWCRHWWRHPGFDWAIIPDVIDGDEKDNERLTGEWFKYAWRGNDRPLGVPVWHLHESLDRLRELCCRNVYRVVAIGSSGQWAKPGTDGWWDRMSEAMDAICDEDGKPPCKLHGLRMLDPAIFHRLPLSSADSTNAVRNGNLIPRFGMYAPPTLSQRQDTIARRIEAHQSAAIWQKRSEQAVLVLQD